MRLFILLMFLALPVTAQDRAGNDRPSDWIVDHARHFGLWDSFCDHRSTDGVRNERCYIRYVDVFSPQPKFGAVFLFVTPEPQVHIGLEPGTWLAPSGLRIDRNAKTVWDDIHPRCRVDLDCRFTGGTAQSLIEQMREGGTFVFEFRDRHGQNQALSWDLGPFAAAYQDYQAGLALRNLPRP